MATSQAVEGVEGVEEQLELQEVEVGEEQEPTVAEREKGEVESDADKSSSREKGEVERDADKSSSSSQSSGSESGEDDSSSDEQTKTKATEVKKGRVNLHKYQESWVSDVNDRNVENYLVNARVDIQDSNVANVWGSVREALEKRYGYNSKPKDLNMDQRYIHSKMVGSIFRKEGFLFFPCLEYDFVQVASEGESKETTWVSLGDMMSYDLDGDTYERDLFVVCGVGISSDYLFKPTARPGKTSAIQVVLLRLHGLGTTDYPHLTNDELMECCSLTELRNIHDFTWVYERNSSQHQGYSHLDMVSMACRVFKTIGRSPFCRNFGGATKLRTTSPYKAEMVQYYPLLNAQMKDIKKAKLKNAAMAKEKEIAAKKARKGASESKHSEEKKKRKRKTDSEDEEETSTTRKEKATTRPLKRRVQEESESEEEKSEEEEEQKKVVARAPPMGANMYKLLQQMQKSNIEITNRIAKVEQRMVANHAALQSEFVEVSHERITAFHELNNYLHRTIGDRGNTSSGRAGKQIDDLVKMQAKLRTDMKSALLGMSKTILEKFSLVYQAIKAVESQQDDKFSNFEEIVHNGLSEMYAQISSLGDVISSFATSGITSSISTALIAPASRQTRGTRAAPPTRRTTERGQAEQMMGSLGDNDDEESEEGRYS